MRRLLPAWLRDGSGIVDSRPMTDERVMARLGYLEAGLLVIAQERGRHATAANRLLETYIALYSRDFNHISNETLLPAIEQNR